jgi:GTP:adenosylcobinamide-phosphate guanylyltransferase
MDCSMTDGKARFTIVILAAQRDGRLDPLAAAAGVSHKCLVPIGGRPLLAHVLEAFEGLKGIEAVRIVVESGAEKDLRPIADASGLPVCFVPSAETITDSVYAGAAGSEGPVVVTTADNVLLTAEAVRAVAVRLEGGDDTVIAIARKEDVLSAHPEGQRRFYKFSDGEFSNCNLYGLSYRGLETAETFREGGQFAKNPMRIARAFGFLNLVRLRYGLVSLDGAMRRLSKRFGVRVSALVLADGAHAIDVDNARTYSIAAELLDRRAA